MVLLCVNSGFFSTTVETGDFSTMRPPLEKKRVDDDDEREVKNSSSCCKSLGAPVDLDCARCSLLVER